MPFFEEIGKALGYSWSKKKSGESASHAEKHAKIDTHTEKLWKDIEERYLKIDDKTGKTFAKIFYEKNHPNWYWLITHASQELIDKIKKESDIEDDG